MTLLNSLTLIAWIRLDLSPFHSVHFCYRTLHWISFQVLSWQKLKKEEKKRRQKNNCTLKMTHAVLFLVGTTLLHTTAIREIFGRFTTIELSTKAQRPPFSNVSCVFFTTWGCWTGWSHRCVWSTCCSHYCKTGATLKQPWPPAPLWSAVKMDFQGGKRWRGIKWREGWELEMSLQTWVWVFVCEQISHCSFTSETVTH